MDINELESFKLSDAVSFHKELNPKLWEDEKLDPEVRDQLMLIAEDFVEYLGISNLKVKDVTISGSNAAYSYTPHSDLDLHVLVDFNELPNNEVYQELFTAKKTLYNDAHDITVRDVPVELYVQDTNNPVQSLGEYSIVHDKWIRIPKKRRANFDEVATKAKYEKLGDLIELALKSKDSKRVNDTIALVKRYRKSGLDKAGEFGPENLAYKAVRKQGLVQALHDLKVQLHTEKLSIDEYANEDYDPNGPPPGPEFKPTMPAGTVKVDVSDVYDWYKLGQHISNLKGLGKHDFGQGPPSTILSFGDEDTEHKYIQDLEKTGLTTTDIDPVDPNQPKGMKRQKTDPTYNVNETEDKKAAVLKIQKHLNKKYGANLDLDGKLGPLTLKSINKFMPRAKTGLADEPNKTTAVQGKKLKEAKIDAHRQGDTIWINYFEVPEKGKGLGTQEYMKFEKSLPKDIKKIRLVASDAGYGPTHEFWDRMGFDYAYPDDDNEMVKLLEASDYSQYESEIEDFVQSLNPDDVGVEQLGPYHVHFEGFTDECQQDAERRCNLPSDNPQHLASYDDVYKEVIRDFVRREGGKKPLKVGFAGYQDYPVIYAVFDNPEPYKNPDAWNPKIDEASGYIPSAKEKNDPRFKTALTVDVKPDAIKKNAKAFGFKTSRAGIPPQARADGKIAEDLMREFKTFLGEQQEEMFPGYDEQHREKRLGNWLAKSWGVQNGKPQTFYHATTKDFDTFNTHGTGFASALGMAYEVERHGSFFAVDPKFAEGFIEDPNTGRVKEGGRVLPVHLSIQSPIDLRDDALSRMLSDEETVEEFKANDIDLRSIYNHFYELERWELFDGPEGAEFIDNLQKLGFDGAIINESIPNDSNAKSGQVWVAFSPNQVKSVYNRGSFSPDDARLTKESG
jgi:predicted nucleotidyltransferase